jgi:pyridoxine/pyridoxamine 5'-phosphate oxidase
MKTLSFHTDNRSGKWKELIDNPQVSWLFYDAPARIQIRAAGSATLFTKDDSSKEAWQKLNANSRKTYMTINPPSQSIAFPSSGLDPKFDSCTPGLEETEFAKPYFGIVETKINWMEWLWLSSGDHRRARFSYKNENNFEASRITP